MIAIFCDVLDGQILSILMNWVRKFSLLGISEAKEPTQVSDLMAGHLARGHIVEGNAWEPKPTLLQIINGYY